MPGHEMQIAWRGDVARPTGLAWLADAARLLVCDPDGGRVASLDPVSGSMAFMEVKGAPSFCFPTRDGELVLGNGPDLVRIDAQGNSEVEIRIDMPSHLRTASGTVDGFGRLWFAAPDRQEDGCDGRVYRYHDGRMIPSLFDRCRPGGVALSADGRTLFHANGKARAIESYRVNPASALSEGQVWARLPDVLGEPQGIALDSDGHLWVTLSGGSIARIASEGEIVETIAVTGGPPADIAFGGTDLRTLYISAPGAILSLDVETPGLPAGVAKLSAGDLGLIEDDDH